jgi:hypothetical protein
LERLVQGLQRDSAGLSQAVLAVGAAGRRTANSLDRQSAKLDELAVGLQPPPETALCAHSADLVRDASKLAAEMNRTLDVFSSLSDSLDVFVKTAEKAWRSPRQAPRSIENDSKANDPVADKHDVLLGNLPGALQPAQRLAEIKGSTWESLVLIQSTLARSDELSGLSGRLLKTSDQLTRLLGKKPSEQGVVERRELKKTPNRLERP